MSDNETGKATNKGWSDRERLVYLFALMENSSQKLDYANTPRPGGRSLIACQRMIERLKGTLKDDLEALKGGQPIGEGDAAEGKAKTPKTPRTPKRKAKAEGDGDQDGSPKKKGRKRKADVAAEVKPEKVEEDLDAEV